MAWKLKAIPEDFIVDEIINDVTEERWKDKLSRIHGHGSIKEQGKYLWFTLKKRDFDFFRAIDMISRTLEISTRDLSYSGTKDKRALTSQTISILGIDEKDAQNISIPGLELSGFRYRRRHVKLGEHSANRFKITIRNISPDEIASTKKRLDIIRKNGIINFFGNQRFGSMRKVNDSVGKHIVLGDFRGAVMELLSITSEREPQRTRSARENLKKTGDMNAAAKEFPNVLGPEHKIISHLLKSPDDHIGALRRLPLRLLKLFVHAYQSKIWNETAKALTAKSGRQLTVPIIGYKTRIKEGGQLKTTIDAILKRENIDAGMFRNKSFPKLSSAGSIRDLIVHPRNLSFSFECDEMNKLKKKVTLSFDLMKGSYATELVRQIQTDSPKYH